MRPMKPVPARPSRTGCIFSDTVQTVCVLGCVLLVEFRSPIHIGAHEHRWNVTSLQHLADSEDHSLVDQDVRTDARRSGDLGRKTRKFDSSISLDTVIVQDDICELPQHLATRMARRTMFADLESGDGNDRYANRPRDHCHLDDQRIPTRVADDKQTIVLLDIPCLLYTSDAADDLLCVDLGGRRIIKK